MGHLDGLVIFVKDGVPGDRVTAKIYRKKKDYAEARLLELLKPSSDRIPAPCPYFGYCGGCQWQHVDYKKQLIFKKELIRESLEHIAGLKDPIIHDVVPSKDIFAYRNKMEFSFSDRRWFPPRELYKRDKEGDFALGLHVPGAFNKVIDIEGCLLQRKRGNRILREIKRFTKDCGIPVYGLKSHKGFWRFLTLRYSTAFDEWMVNIVTSQQEGLDFLQPMTDILCRETGRIKTVVNNINDRKASIAVGDQEVLLSGDGYIKDMLGPFTFRISANSFFQTNTLTATKLYEQVIKYSELNGNETVLALYCGTGTIPIFLSTMAKYVIGLEISKSAVLDAEKNCKENGIHNCSFICGDIRETLQAITLRPEVLIIDPPRSGMHKDVLAKVLALSPQKIVYISCNPATMARDIGQLVGNYELIEIQPFDMFPHTYHIEAIAKLAIRKKPV